MVNLRYMAFESQHVITQSFGNLPPAFFASRKRRKPKGGSGKEEPKEKPKEKGNK